MRTASLICLLACPALLLAQPAITELRATGEHRMANGDTTETAHALARADAQRKLWRAAVTALQVRADVKALQLKATQLEAYTAVLLDPAEQPAPTGTRPASPVQQVMLSAALDGAKLAAQMAALRKDQDATFELLAAWTQLQQPQDGRTFAARLLAAKATAAVARTEPATIGGRAASAEGRQRARALTDEALKLVPGLPSAHYVRGDLLIDEGKPADAETEYRKGLASQPDSSEGHRRLAEALRRQGRLDEAAAELREALRLDPTSARAHSDLALVFEGDSRTEDAAAEYRAAIRLDVDLIDAHNGLAILLARQQKLPDAIVEFREMIRIDPDSATAYYNLASALANMDQDIESAAALREVIRINPNHYNAHYNLGELFRLEGKYDESAKQFREFLRLAPGDTAAGKRNIERAKGFVEKFESPSR